jgi:hypothetical protein
MGLFGPKKLKEEDYYFTIDHSFTSKPQEDYSPESFTFKHAYMTFVYLMAKDWFGENPVPIREALKRSELVNADDFYSPASNDDVDFLGEPSVDRSLIKSYSHFDGCERISWKSSEIAKRWQRTLESKGVNFHEMKSPQNLELDIIMGNWVLFDGETVLPIIGEAWKDTKTGKEFIYWFIDALARTRKTSVSPLEYPSHQFFYPELFQRVGYLSETVFPSSMVRIRDRKMEFGVEKDEQVPKIALNVQTDYYVMGIGQGEKELNVRYDWAPEATRYGYIVDELVPFESVDEIVIQLVNALPKVASILMDGYANWSFKEDLSFQSELFTDLDLSDTDNQDIFDVGLNVPGHAYCALAWKSVMSYSLLDELQRNQKLMDNFDNMMFHREGLFRIASQGVGPATVHALNTLYFRIISQDDVTTIPEPAREKIEKIITFFAQYPFDRQDANAYSNLALLQTAWGKHKKALISADKGIALFNTELQQKHVTEMSGGGQFYPIIIKWELYLTKARVLVLLNKPEEAKEPLVSLIREARAMKFNGQELADAEGLLSSL